MTTATNVFSEDNSSLATSIPTVIPVVDFKHDSTDETTRLKVAKEIVNAFHTYGFAYLSNTGIPQEEIDTMFNFSAEFFKKDLDYKLKCEWECPESNRGYVPQGREKLSELDKAGRADDIKQLRKVNPDLKESFEIGKEDPEGTYQNRWPTEWPEFSSQCQKFYNQVHELNVSVMGAIGLGLGLEKGYMESFVTKADNNLRLLHYPSVEKAKLQSDENRRAGAHCDYGSLTFLFQDDKGGLEVMDYKTGEFVKAPPIPGTIVVNVGDMFQRWSNDYFKSTLHRVVKPYTTEDEQIFKDRYSIPYFCNPNFDSIIECLPNCYSDSNPKKYEPISSFDHLVERLSNTFSY